MKTSILVILLTMTSLNSFGSVSCRYAKDESKNIQLIISQLEFDEDDSQRLFNQVPAVTLIEIEKNPYSKKITYHETEQDRTPSPVIYLTHDIYKYFSISKESFLKDAKHTKVTLYKMKGEPVELTCFDQSVEIRRMFFNH